jgi:guanylate kinase
MGPVHYRGSQLLQFVPEQQYKMLQRSSQLAGVHKHLGHSYGVALAAIEAIAADGKAALVVGALAVAEQLKQDLPDTQVG